MEKRRTGMQGEMYETVRRKMKNDDERERGERKLPSKI